MYPATADITLMPDQLTFTSNMTSHIVSLMAREGKGEENATISSTIDTDNVALSPDSAVVTIIDRDSEY